MADEPLTIEQMAEELAALKAGTQERADRDFAAVTNQLGARIATEVQAAVQEVEARHLAEIEQLHARLEELQRLITDVDSKITQAAA